MKTIFFCQTGPMLKAGNGSFECADLNPEKVITFRMSRWEMIQVALRLLMAAARRNG